MSTRNTRNSLIFSGTMGIIRADILKEIGGWDEWCITEDAEASFRILQRGYKGVYIAESYGYGLLPQSFGDMKRQWFRWMVGGAQIVRKHHLYNLLKPLQKSNLSFAQQWDYLLGGSMSFGALLMISSGLFLAIATIFMFDSPQRFLTVFAALSTSIAVFSYFLILTGFTFILPFRLKMKFSWQDSLLAFSTLLALSFTRGLAFLYAFIKGEIPFRRTSKFVRSDSLLEAIKSVRGEIMTGILISVLGFLLIVLLQPHRLPYGLIILLGWQLISYLSAIYTAIRSVIS